MLSVFHQLWRDGIHLWRDVSVRLRRCITAAVGAATIRDRFYIALSCAIVNEPRRPSCR